MDELKNLLLEQHRFNIAPSAANYNRCVQAMLAYQLARSNRDAVHTMTGRSS